MPSKVRKSITNIQGLRGYAILLVFISHSDFGMNALGIRRTVWLGAFGVSIFIMLSGYLLMENHSETSFQYVTYVKRKLIRFYPLHIVSLLAALLFEPQMLTDIYSKKFLSNLLLIHAWIPRQEFYFSYNAVSWYLSVTVFLVVISPLVLLLWYKFGRSLDKVFCVIVICVLLDAIWSILCMNNPKAHWLIYIFPIVRVMEYIIGSGIWKLCHNIKKLRYDVVGLISVVVSGIVILLSINSSSELFSSVIWLIPSLLILLFSSGQTNLSQYIFSNRAIKSLGDISFEFFLIHWLCIQYVRMILAKVGLDNRALDIGISFIVSVIFSYLLNIINRKCSNIMNNIYRIES